MVVTGGWEDYRVHCNKEAVKNKRKQCEKYPNKPKEYRQYDTQKQMAIWITNISKITHTQQQVYRAGKVDTRTAIGPTEHSKHNMMQIF